MPAHRALFPGPLPGPSLSGVLRRNALTMAVANISAAAGLLIGQPGSSPSLAFLALVAPLWAWAIPFAVAALLQVANRPLAGHTLAVLPWLMLAFGAVAALINGSSPAPSASIIFSGVILYCALHHVNAAVFRRQEGLTRRRK